MDPQWYLKSYLVIFIVAKYALSDNALQIADKIRTFVTDTIQSVIVS